MTNAAFRESILDGLTPLVRARQGNSRQGISGSHNVQESERLIAGELKELGINQRDLPKMPKGVAEKIAIASVVNKRTLVTNARLAARLHMGATTRMSWYCGKQNLTKEIKNLVKKLEC